MEDNILHESVQLFIIFCMRIFIRCNWRLYNFFIKVSIHWKPCLFSHCEIEKKKIILFEMFHQYAYPSPKSYKFRRFFIISLFYFIFYNDLFVVKGELYKIVRLNYLFQKFMSQKVFNFLHWVSLNVRCYYSVIYVNGFFMALLLYE